MRRLAISLALLAAPLAAGTELPPSRWANTQLPDRAQEQAASELMLELRCLVCQGQSIADSDADMAGEMRAFVRSRIAAGNSPRDVRAWLVERYGAWISFKPPVEPLTWPLWAAPLLLVLGGLWLLRGRFRRRPS